MPHRVTANFAIVFAAAWLAATAGALAQDVIMEAPPGMDNGMAPMTSYGEGNYFSQELGTILRLRYSTESYGQSGRGNFDIGTMQVWSLDSSAAFFDGQVTLNELEGVGYNLGLGYRMFSNPAISRGAGRMNGVSVWTDGTSTDSGNFFPQIGLSLESLGDMWDLRANGYLPLGPQDQTGEFTPTGVIGLTGNSIAELTQAVVNTSYSVAEIEAARRLGSERDAWAFAGPYFVGNDDDDSVGYRAGIRGYAYPDLLLQIAVTDDEIFKTNATFSVTWFVGRTRTDFQPACGVPDRIREPVLRNDYVALSQSFVNGGIPLTSPDGSALRIVHVNGNTDVLGDGTFERPLADEQLDDVEDFSQEGDVILAWAGSDFNNVFGQIELQDRQRFLGEGQGVEHTVDTQQDGIVIIPETSPGARTAERPDLFNPAPGLDAIVLADANEVNNFDIDGTGVDLSAPTATAIASQAAGSGNPVLRNLGISDMAIDGIRLTPLAVVDTDDVDNDGNLTETFIRGNVTIADVTFTDIGEDDIDIDSATAIDVTLPNVTLQEVISIAGVVSTGNGGRSIAIANTHTGAGRTATINNFTYTGGAAGLGGIVLTNFDSTFNATNSTLTGGNIAGAGAQILGDSDGTMTFASTFVFNDLTGTAVDINGTDAGTDSLGGTITVNGVITTTGTGRSVRVRNVTNPANIDFNGNITDNAGGILIGDTVVANGNSGGTITFATGTIDLDIATGNAITVANNTGTTIEFTGPVDIDATGAANGLVATGGGTLRYSNPANSIDAVNGQAVNIQNMTIQAANGVVISDINRTGAVATAAVQLENNTGGPITLGNVADTTPGDSGTLNGGTNVDTVVINDSANVTMSNIIINSGANAAGVRIDKQSSTGTQTVTLNDLIINEGDIGIDVFGGTAGASALNLSLNDVQILDPTAIGLRINEVDSGAMNFVNLDIDGIRNNAGTAGARGVLINDVDSTATVTFDVNSEVRDFLGTTFQVNDGVAGTTSSGSITFNGDIFNNGVGDTSGLSVLVQQVTGTGVVNFTNLSSIEDTNEGILVQNNTGGTISFLGDNNLNTDENTAVTVTSNTGATIRFSNLDIDTDEGNGFVATGGGTLEVTTTAGTTNTITTADGTDAVLGVGLQIEDMIIGGGGVTFQEVDVTDGDARGIVLSDLTGGTVTIGTLAGNSSQLTTVGDAIVLENVANAVFNNVQVVNASNAASQGVDIDQTVAATTTMNVTFNNLTVSASGAEGIDVDAVSTQEFNLRLNNSTLAERVTMDNSGAGTFQVLLNNADITIATGADDALAINFNIGTADGDVTIQGGSDIIADSGRALDMVVNGAGTSVEVLIENSTFESASAADLFLVNNVGAKTDATIRNNTFDTGGAANDVEIQSLGSAGAGTRLDLNLVGNGPDANADIVLTTDEIVNPPFNFGVVDRDNVDDNNAADVTLLPLPANFEDIEASDVELPNGP